VLVGEEPDRPYERPPLSKEILLGKAGREKAYVHSETWYVEHQVELLAGARRAVDEIGGLEVSVGAVPRAGLRPVERDDVVTLLRRDARDLQAGQDADVVLGRRAAEAHGDG